MTIYKGTGNESRLLSVAVAASRSGILITDTNLPDDPIVYANPGFEKLTGYKAEEVLGKNCRFLQGEDHDQPALEELRSALEEEQECRVVLRNYKKDGTLFWNELSISPIHDGEGHLTNYVGVQEDVTERKRAEDALRESKRKIENILESVTDAFFTLDRGLRFTYLNSEAKRFLGRTREELLGKNVWEEFPEALESTFYREYHKALRERKPVGFEAFYPPVETWFDVRAYPSEEGLSVYFRDISDRKRAEEERERLLRDSERRAAELDAVIRSIPEAVYIGDENGISICNGAALEMLGFEDVAELNHNIATLAAKIRTRLAETGERIPPEEEPFARALRGETVVQEVITRHLKSGQDVTLRCAAAPIRHEGRIMGAVAVNTDVTERKRAEEALRESEERYRVLYEDNPSMYFTLGEGGTVLSVNRFGAEHLGYEPGELVGRSVLDLFHEEDRRSAAGHLDALLRGPDCASIWEGRKVRKDGALMWVQERASVVRTAGGGRIVLVVCEDVTERKRAEEALRAVREAERSRMARDLHDEALQDLIYALQSMRVTHAEASVPGLKADLEREIGALERAVLGLRGAIYDLRLDGGGEERTFVEMLRSMVELNRQSSPEREIELSVEERFAPPLVRTRQLELVRILQEALANARRHSGARNIRVAVGSREGKLWAEVSDDGRGFEPGQTPDGMGTKGMRERARALGGDLEVRSEPGKGTKVRFELNLELDGEQARERARVLLVEDHASFRQAAASVFEKEQGLAIVGQAGSLAEAKELLDAGPVDVAVIDLGLPDGYGGDLIKELRERNPRAQALVLTANLDKAEVARAVESGAAGVLHKSSGMDEVVEAVRRLRAGETLMPLEEVVELLRFAGSRREEEYEARQAIAQLTPREKEVLRALAEGLHGEEIARRLHISDKTERNHVASILKKLGVHSQLQAVLFALRHGAVDLR